MDDDIITIKRGDEEIVLTEKRLRDLTSRFIELCGKEAVTYEDFGMNSKMVDMLIKAKIAWFPATQKNLNLNVENFDNKLKLWLKAREEMSKEKTGIIVETISE